MDDTVVSVRATRAYIILLVASLVVLTFYASLSEYTRTLIINNPPADTFNALFEIYADKLVCPCSQIAIPFESIATGSSPRFHQVCSSDFTKDKWILGFFGAIIRNESIAARLHENDFRKNAVKIFEFVQGFCVMVQYFLRIFETTFFQDELVTAFVLPKTQFNVQVSALIETFKVSNIEQISYLLRLVRTWVMGSGIPSGLTYHSAQVNGTWMVYHDFPAPSGRNVCACSVAFNCPDPLWSGGQIHCKHGNNCTENTVIWSVPGFPKGCSNLESIVTADLRCFYNQTCLNILLSMHAVDLPELPPLSESVYNISALNVSAHSKYSPDDSLEIIFQQLMLEEWNIESNYMSYYTTCSPVSCTYTQTRRLDILYVISTIVGLFGGLSVIIRILVPISVRFVHFIGEKWQQRHSHHSRQDEGLRRTFIEVFLAPKRFFFTMNLFKRECAILRDPTIQPSVMIASRIYFLLLILSLIIIAFFNGLNKVSLSETVENPSLFIFEKLQASYSSTISCTCQKISISYEKFLNVVPHYHPVCSSDFISSSWTTALFGINNTAFPYMKLDRPLLSRQHQILGWICEDTRKLVEYAIFDFQRKNLVSTIASSRSSFQTQISSIMKQFIERVPLNFRRFTPFMSEILTGNLLASIFNDDWSLKFGNASNSYLIRSVPRVFPNSTCNCAISRKCSRPLRVGPSTVILPGLFVGCTPVDGLLISTLECLFSTSCISSIIEHLEYYLEIDGSEPNSFSPSPTSPVAAKHLNASLLTQFTSATKIETMVNALFVDHWTTNISFENYYATCAPRTCRYEYETRNTFIYLLTALLGVYGGLTVGLRIIIWNLMRFYRNLTRIAGNSQTPVQPI